MVFRGERERDGGTCHTHGAVCTHAHSHHRAQRYTLLNNTPDDGLINFMWACPRRGRQCLARAAGIHCSLGSLGIVGLPARPGTARSALTHEGAWGPGSPRRRTSSSLSSLAAAALNRSSRSFQSPCAAGSAGAAVGSIMSIIMSLVIHDRPSSGSLTGSATAGAAALSTRPSWLAIVPASGARAPAVGTEASG